MGNNIFNLHEKTLEENSQAAVSPAASSVAGSSEARSPEIVYQPESNPEGRIGATETVYKTPVAKTPEQPTLLALALQRKKIMDMSMA